jgi:protein TonB
VHVLRGVGMGLDERAIAAVKQYKFKPAMQGGRPVAVELERRGGLSDLLSAARV